ncbi:MAG: hypothetical protein U5R49_04550 [Deltaproteobacteria bacterium]|nr:hypothetical protein [Deltaproteobacteria bacterium]
MLNERDYEIRISRFEKKPGVAVAARTVHGCLDHIWWTFRLRARLFLLEGDDLVLRDCAGAYCICPEIGLKVHPDSIVWEILQKGTAMNLNDPLDHEGRVHSLPEPVNDKAVIPLKCRDVLPCKGEKALGVLVVDGGDLCKPIDERDFQYLNLVGMLLSEVLARSMLINRIRKIQQEKAEMGEEICHIFRNRFTVIGGVSRRLTKLAEDPTLRLYARIILKEMAKAEKALKRWRKLHKKEQNESGYLC